MDITTLIMENLRAMGANPERIESATGETLIKVNAERIGTNENTENKKV